MILIINTADGEEIYIALVEKGKIAASKKIKAKYRQAEKLLPAIFCLLRRITRDARRFGGPADGTDNLLGIAAVTGPGSFSALRIGVSVANTLGWALKIPAAGVRLSEFENLNELAAVAEQKVRKAKVGTVVAPHYGSEPKITMTTVIGGVAEC